MSGVIYVYMGILEGKTMLLTHVPGFNIIMIRSALSSPTFIVMVASIVAVVINQSNQLKQ